MAVEVWMRPCASVWGTRWTRWTPLSYLKREWAPSPLTSKMISLMPPAGFSLKETMSVRHFRRSA